MKALTIWQPWASLIIAGAKPYEFRGWTPPRSLIGARVAIHAGARPMRLVEVMALLERLASDGSWATGLIPEIAAPILLGARDFLARSGPTPLFEESPRAGLPLSSVLGTAILGTPTKNPVVAGRHLTSDSDRTDHLNWGWPLTGVVALEPPIPARGAQGFWDWNGAPA